MDAFDWMQSASLRLVNGREFTGDGRARVLTRPVADGPLIEVLDIYLQQRDGDRGRCRLVIKGGFHLDGSEIDALIQVRP